MTYRTVPLSHPGSITPERTKESRRVNSERNKALKMANRKRRGR